MEAAATDLAKTGSVSFNLKRKTFFALAKASLFSCLLRRPEQISLHPQKQGGKSAVRPVFWGKNEVKRLWNNILATTTVAARRIGA
jgi:hypothetical protein